MHWCTVPEPGYSIDGETCVRRRQSIAIFYAESSFYCVHDDSSDMLLRGYTSQPE